MKKIDILIAQEEHFHYAPLICEVIADSAKKRGTGIARRTPQYVTTRMKNGNAIIAVSNTGEFAGFCYIEAWGHGDYVAHSGLIVAPNFRHMGLAKRIKAFTFQHSLNKYPDAKIFGITTGLAVMKINSSLGYKPVTFSELTDDPKFWAGCNTCTNVEILKSKDNKMCLCTGMLYDPKEERENAQNRLEQERNILKKLEKK